MVLYTLKKEKNTIRIKIILNSKSIKRVHFCEPFFNLIKKYNNEKNSRNYR